MLTKSLLFLVQMIVVTILLKSTVLFDIGKNILQYLMLQKNQGGAPWTPLIFPETSKKTSKDLRLVETKETNPGQDFCFEFEVHLSSFQWLNEKKNPKNTLSFFHKVAEQNKPTWQICIRQQQYHSCLLMCTDTCSKHHFESNYWSPSEVQYSLCF